MRPPSVWGMSPNTFPYVSVIKCNHYCLTGTSMSQVVDRIVLDKIQSDQFKRKTLMIDRQLFNRRLDNFVFLHYS